MMAVHQAVAGSTILEWSANRKTGLWEVMTRIPESFVAYPEVGLWDRPFNGLASYCRR
jgi:hypothetical protein